MAAGKSIVILGAGFAGLAAANMLRRELGPEHRVVVIDRKKWFMMGLVNLWILQGTRRLEESRTPLEGLGGRGIEFLNDEIARIDLQSSAVETKAHGRLSYDYLVVALGAELVPERVDGFAGRGFNLYDPEQVPGLRERLLSLRKGKIAISIMGMPYKCPPAPYEAAMIIDEILSKNGTRQSVEIDIYAPSPIALPVAGPQVSAMIVEMVSKHGGIRFHPMRKLRSVSDAELAFEDGSRERYDVLVGIPQHRAPDAVKNSGLVPAGSEWVSVDRRTLRTPFRNVFAAGDSTEIKAGPLAMATTTAATAATPAMAIPKAGIFAEAQAKVVARQIIDEISSSGEGGSAAAFDGRGYCFMEVGGRQAGYIDADFFAQPGPSIRMEPPSEQNLEKKREFERSRIREWLLLP